MSAQTDEVLRGLAALELEICARFKAINEKLDRALVLLHAIERDAKPIEMPPTRKQ